METTNSNSVQSTDPACTLSKPLYIDGRFQNPWSTWKDLEWYKTFRFFLTKNERNIPTDQNELDKVLPIIKPDFTQFGESPVTGVRHMWVGHATSLIQMDGITFLTDPVFSNRGLLSKRFGRSRYRPPPCSIEELPHLDFVVISHNHYDHLDYDSVCALNRRFGDNLRWYVPMCLKRWMNECGCNNVVEMTWWQEQAHSESSGVKVVCTPCQHWCKRTATDTNKVLWCSWSILGPKNKFHFAGDTGYCDGFKEIGQQYGPFTLATIPIGAYKPRDFLGPQHVSPVEAVDIHNDIQAQTSIGIHWGTYPQGKEFYLAPRDELKEEVSRRGMSPLSFITVHHGGISVFGADHTSS